MARLLPAPDRASEEVQRLRVIRRLVMDEWLDELDAEAWTAIWEREADFLGVDRHALEYWDEGLRWIVGKRSRLASTGWNPLATIDNHAIA